MGKARRRARPQHDADYKRLCALLRRWREDAGLTQVELGAEFNRPHTFVHKCETGERRIDPIEFVRWTRACRLDPCSALAELLESA